MIAIEDVVAHVTSSADYGTQLAGYFDRCRQSLAWQVDRDAKYPTRTLLRERLSSLQVSIREVIESYDDFSLTNLLLAGDDTLENSSEILSGLEVYALRVANALAAIREGRGRDKHYLRPEAPSPQTLCALMISIGWRRAHDDKLPAHNSAAAQRACAALWAFAGCEKTKISPQSTVNWRDYLKQANSLQSSPEALQILRLFESGT